MLTKVSISEFENWVRGKCVEYSVPGLAVGIAKDGELLYARGFGYRDISRARVVRPGTVFGVASLTKSLTAAAIMQLQEIGLISVQDPVIRYFPELDVQELLDARHVTIHEMLTHTSGLRGIPSEWWVYGLVETIDDLIAAIGKRGVRSLRVPGEFSFFSDGYVLLGAIVERVSGRPYPAFVQEQLLDPAGMAHSCFGPEAPAVRNRLTTFYVSRPSGTGEQVIAMPGWWFSPVLNAAGGLCSTVLDMLRYLEMYRTGGVVSGKRVLASTTVSTMTHRHIDLGAGTSYGYAWMLSSHQGIALVENEGGRGGISAYAGVMREPGISIITLANLFEAPTRLVSLGAINLLLGLPFETPSVVFSTYEKEQEWGPYVGCYESEEEDEIHVATEGSVMVFRYEPQGLSRVARYRVRPVGRDAFAVTVRGIERYARFLRDGGGLIYALAFSLRVFRKTASGSGV